MERFESGSSGPLSLVPGSTVYTNPCFNYSEACLLAGRFHLPLMLFVWSPT